VELAPQVAAQDVALFDLLAVFVGGETAAKWITLAGFVCWILTQLVAWLPPSWLAKCPDWLLKIIKVMAGNYRSSANGLVNDPEQIRRANTAAAKPAR
ncbi:MAG: hypothetical protein LPH21_10825, partial [Shewanella sp.]|nr:hypothetical protein [Shewanella sp.]